MKMLVSFLVLCAYTTVGLAAIPRPTAAQLHYQNQEIVALTHFKYVFVIDIHCDRNPSLHEQQQHGHVLP